ncbi:hypothetical protein pb186bvf_017742 [Paramecium bursaria]
MFSVITLGGKIVYEYLFPCQAIDSTFQWIVSILLIISGFSNLYILKPKTTMFEQSTQWIGIVHLKLLTSILLLTPILGYAIDNPINIQFWLVLLWLIVSPYLRFYREKWQEYYQANL